jgi:hypothetical protein
MNIFKQESNYGCGLYALANIFKDESFITEKRLNDSINGNHTGQLNTWLMEHGCQLYIEPFFFDSNGKKLPEWVCDMRPSGEDAISIPLLIDVQISENSKTHFIACELTTNGELLVMDSLKEKAYLTTLSELNDKNHRVFGVWYLRHYIEEGHYMRYKK